MYFFVQGVATDYIYAHMWSSFAISNGNESGAIMQGSAAKNMTQSQLDKAQDLARECVRKKYKGCWVNENPPLPKVTRSHLRQRADTLRELLQGEQPTQQQFVNRVLGNELISAEEMLFS